MLYMYTIPDCSPPEQPAPVPVAHSQTVEEARRNALMADGTAYEIEAAIDALISAVRGEQEAVMNVMSSTFADVNDSRFKWKARAEAAEAQLAALMEFVQVCKRIQETRAFYSNAKDARLARVKWSEALAALTTPTSDEVPSLDGEHFGP